MCFTETAIHRAALIVYYEVALDAITNFLRKCSFEWEDTDLNATLVMSVSTLILYRIQISLRRKVGLLLLLSLPSLTITTNIVLLIRHEDTTWIRFWSQTTACIGVMSCAVMGMNSAMRCAFMSLKMMFTITKGKLTSESTATKQDTTTKATTNGDEEQTTVHILEKSKGIEVGAGFI